jgi:hypothetical protein
MASSRLAERGSTSLGFSPAKASISSKPTSTCSSSTARART